MEQQQLLPQQLTIKISSDINQQHVPLSLTTIEYNIYNYVPLSLTTIEYSTYNYVPLSLTTIEYNT